MLHNKQTEQTEEFSVQYNDVLKTMFKDTLYKELFECHCRHSSKSLKLKLKKKYERLLKRWIYYDK